MAASILNDPSAENVTTNLLGLLPGFDGPMAIIGAFNDLFDYKMHQDTPTDKFMVIPASVSDGNVTIPNPDLDPCGGLCN